MNLAILYLIYCNFQFKIKSHWLYPIWVRPGIDDVNIVKPMITSTLFN